MKIQPRGLPGTCVATSAPTVPNTTIATVIAIAPLVEVLPAPACQAALATHSAAMVTSMSAQSPQASRVVHARLIAGPPCSQSDACVGLHRLRARRRAGRARERVEVDLLAQPRAEALERALRVVATPVEATVDDPLHPRAHGQEQRRDDERRCRDRQVRATCERREQRLARQDEPDVRRHRERRSAPRRRSTSRSPGRCRTGGSAAPRFRSRSG